MTLIAVGKIADLWGRKKVFYCGVVIFGVAALMAGLSRTIEMLVLFRGLQALGAATVWISPARNEHSCFLCSRDPILLFASFS
jgi:MFS family permease